MRERPIRLVADRFRSSFRGLNTDHVEALLIYDSLVTEAEADTEEQRIEVVAHTAGVAELHVDVGTGM